MVPRIVFVRVSVRTELVEVHLSARGCPSTGSGRTADYLSPCPVMRMGDRHGQCIGGIFARQLYTG